jgi:hypothetical protein
MSEQQKASATRHDGRTAVIQTPWGDLEPLVDVRPLVGLLVLYGVVYFFPFYFFDALRKGEDGFIEWIQMLCYGFAGLLSLLIAWRGDRVSPRWQRWGWLLLGIACLFVAAEEVSWGERLHGFGVEFIREINSQEETTLHNIPAVQGGLHFAFIACGLFGGYAGWRWWPGIPLFPSRWLSLYFLPVALFYAYFDLSWLTNGERIRNDQEVFELLLAIGLALHARTNWRRLSGRA